MKRIASKTNSSILLRSMIVLAVLIAGAAFLLSPPPTHANSVPLYSFSGYSDGAEPLGGLVQGSDGNFYGTTRIDGPGGGGTVFKITFSGSLTTLYSFHGSDGGLPTAGLVQGRDGDFYGTTSEGGATGDYLGTIFKITPDGSLTILHTFEGSDGATPYAGLVEGSNGNFYGTTANGGAAGTVFKISSSGSFTSYTFHGSDGASPWAGLVQGSDGNFYGTTRLGGASGYGTVFKITSGGSLTSLYSFSYSDGAYPQAGLVQGRDGNFYGTTAFGGGGNSGTVFMITSDGSLTTLYSFSYSDGAYPYAGLVEGRDGNFYGTTVQGGAGVPYCCGGYGTVFKITSGGSLTTLYTFNGSDGAFPWAELAQGSDGNFYGTTAGGGASGYGTVFKITVPTNADQCKNGGWATYTSPRTFKNQGDCIQFVETGK